MYKPCPNSEVAYEKFFFKELLLNILEIENEGFWLACGISFFSTEVMSSLEETISRCSTK